MIIDIDGQLYHVDFTKPINAMRMIYAQLNTDEGIITPTGKIMKIDKGLLRTSIKMIITPIIIPMLEEMYKEQGIILDKPIRHSDLIDYSVNALIDLLEICEKRVYANIASETNPDSSKTIRTITPIVKETLAIVEPFGDNRENE